MDTDRDAAVQRRIAVLHTRIAGIARAQIADAETMRDLWALYAAAVLPRAVAPVDRDACRTAFYTGASAALGLFFHFADDADDGVARTDALRRELLTFADDLPKADRP
jgi:hypothetical protein